MGVFVIEKALVNDYDFGIESMAEIKPRGEDLFNCEGGNTW